MLMQCWPVNLNLRIAKFLGNLLYRFDRKHRERALANLRRSFPDMPERRREYFALRSHQDLIMLGVEVLFTNRLIHLNTWAKYIVLAIFREVVGLLLDNLLVMIL